MTTVASSRCNGRNHETKQFKIFKKGSLVSRRAVAVGEIRGHMVSGHIDGVGEITSYEKEDNAIWITINTTMDLLNTLF